METVRTDGFTSGGVPFIDRQPRRPAPELSRPNGPRRHATRPARRLALRATAPIRDRAADISLARSKTLCFYSFALLHSFLP